MQTTKLGMVIVLTLLGAMNVGARLHLLAAAVLAIGRFQTLF